MNMFMVVVSNLEDSGIDVSPALPLASISSGLCDGRLQEHMERMRQKLAADPDFNPTLWAQSTDSD